MDCNLPMRNSFRIGKLSILDTVWAVRRFKTYGACYQKQSDQLLNAAIPVIALPRISA